jgi:CBS domain-containing protein
MQTGTAGRWPDPCQGTGVHCGRFYHWGDGLEVRLTVIPEIVDFLRQYPPFNELDPADVDLLAGAVEIEFHPSGEIIFAKGSQPVDALRVIRAGSVEVVSNTQVLDLMAPGEMFGHASMLSGLPPGFEARAAEDVLAYRIPAAIAAQVFGGPRGLRYVTRLLLEDRHHLRTGPTPDAVRDQLRQPVRAAIRSAPIIVEPATTVREAARQMTAAGLTAIVVDLGRTVGIVTDSDLRERVVAQGLGGDTPVSAVMTAPAHTVPDDRAGSEVLLDMLDRGVRHFPVTSASGRVIGLVEDHDLVAAQSRSSFSLRRAVARARNVDELVEASANLYPAVVNLTRGGMAALDVMSVLSVVTDAMIRRALDFCVADAGEAPTRFSWLALGSLSRREALPSSDLDSAIVWLDGGDERVIRDYLGRVATGVTDALLRCGLHPDEHQVTASDPLFIQSLTWWRQAGLSMLDDPDQEKALVISSVLVDSRPVWGVESEPLIAEIFRLAPARPRMLRLLGQFALSHKPPVGFLKGIVVESSGEYRNRLDLKKGVVAPVTDLARWAGMAAGVTSASTTQRLRAAADAGLLDAADAQTLQDAFELGCQLRLEHQVAQLDAGLEPDDFIDLEELSPLIRSYLKEAFHAVAGVQKAVAANLTWGS